MKKVYVSYCTEYESGLGQSLDGLLFSLNEDVILKEINVQENLGSYECYWRYTSPELYLCSEDVFDIAENELLNDVGFFHSNKKQLSDFGEFFKKV